MYSLLLFLSFNKSILSINKSILLFYKKNFTIIEFLSLFHIFYY